MMASLNLIFWIVMGCGIARFGRRGLKTPKTQHFWVFILSPGTLTRGAARESRSPAPRVQVSCGAASWGPWDKMKTEKCWVLGVYRPLWPKSPHYYPKYEIWMIEKIVNNPFKVWKWWNSAFHHWHILIWRYLKNQFSLSKIFFWSKLGQSIHMNCPTFF